MLTVEFFFLADVFVAVEAPFSFEPRISLRFAFAAFAFTSFIHGFHHGFGRLAFAALIFFEAAEPFAFALFDCEVTHGI